MIDPSLYKNREQTYVKHFVLKKYLERVAYNIYSFRQDFAYIDGFSGPWKSEDDTYEDTSFKIALDQLRTVRKNVKDGIGKDVNFRCMFIEKHPKPFRELQAAVSGIDDVHIEIVNGPFEDNIDKICAFASNYFSLIFIDPTGWQGFPMEKISPLLNLSRARKNPLTHRCLAVEVAKSGGLCAFIVETTVDAGGFHAPEPPCGQTPGAVRWPAAC